MFAQKVEMEVSRARKKHPAIHSFHEGYAVILEELDEVKEEVWKKSSKRKKKNLLAELVQTAAMCQRMAEDCGLVD